MPGQAPDLSGLPANSPSPQAQLSAQAQQPTVNPPDHTPKLKQLLSSFFVGAGSAMMHQVGLETPQEKQAREFRQGIQQQQLSSLDKERQALEGMQQAAALKSQQEAMGVSVTPEIAQMTGMPVGSKIPKPLMDFITKKTTTGMTVQGRENVADTNAQGRITVAQDNNKTKQQIADDANATRIKVMQRTLASRQLLNGGGVPTAQRANKADLAVNIQQNVDDMKKLIDAEPELFGKIAGRYTTFQQMMGSDDPHIAVIGIAGHNAALANNSIHGIRSADGAKTTEAMILNHFRNGPDATKAALDEMARSAGTFITSAQLGKAAPASKPSGATHRFNVSTGRIEPIGK